MCGDIEEEGRYEDELVARMLALAAHRYGIDPESLPELPPRDIASDRDRHAYMDESFREALRSALGKAGAVPPGQRPEALASQAIVLARLAGWLAGTLPPGADMMRSMMEAMLDGYNEPARAAEEAADHHHDHHNHHPGHDQDHGGVHRH